MIGFAMYCNNTMYYFKQAKCVKKIQWLKIIQSNIILTMKGVKYYELKRLPLLQQNKC